ncbi:hypothetical protein Ae201684P_012930 [Aphanomyces euteiches]|uniref:Uncharacterized protein n=1 Tax=Aphanomyces euteiches TaxID=100861 RepID=A0A6G0XG74_9STRA|nr:hypothetical protein Ae201684_005152 [Aphanomyces euteiches]KAH9080792.1 hypothetical protein Ae201684P_012930 [Aphanomyces euteiches]KAH9136664.1 hypothetical protein AeRB84_018306 [Aphanomyces euteiches]
MAQRQYFRCKQREYRHRLKCKRSNLLQELAYLQGVLSNFPPARHISEDGMLSWKVIAWVLKEARRDSKDEYNHLQDLVDTNTSLIYEMTRFLQVCQPRPMTSLASMQPIHQYVTLMANGNARVQAKPWLVQQLYHNTDRFFHNFPALSISEEFIDCTAECAGPWVHTVDACQFAWPHTVGDIKKLFAHPHSQEIICLTDEYDLERDGNTLLARGIIDQKYPWHLLQGHFYEADRFIAVHRSLNNDEAFQGREDPNIHDIEWVDVRQISSTHSIVRVLVHRSMLLEDMEIFAKDVGKITLSKDKKTMEQQVSSFDKKMMWDCLQKMKNLLATRSA